ncbi:DNA-directed RNA polymerase subunit beta', partial [bacterium]|nr:DNA-directed RNA polymerase subunit beta' [bacterium]
MSNLIKTTDFEAIRLRLASPKVIHDWSYGEILRPETINYRTQKPEKDGLFCEKIFGPSKDWECYCGKYKKIRYKGIICDKCGVEVTRSIVRRERMGHIDLAAPVSHIWFLRSVPSRVGSLLGLSPSILEKIIYFANFIVTNVDQELKQKVLEELKQEYKEKKKKISKKKQSEIQEIKSNTKKDDKAREKQIAELIKAKDEEMDELDEIFAASEKELKELKEMKILTEMQYQNLSLKYGHIFEAGIGAEAVKKLLEKIDLDKSIDQVKSEMKIFKGAKKEKAIKEIKILRNLKNNDVRPEWMVLTVIPVIPPD